MGTNPQYSGSPGQAFVDEQLVLENHLSVSPILNSLTNAIIVTNEDGKISWVNKQVENIFGYTGKDLVGQKIEVLLPERYWRRHVDHRKDYIAEPGVREMGSGIDLYARRKDGTEFPCEIGLSPLQTAQGNYVVSGLVDISKRRHAEDARLESERILSKQYAELKLLYKTAPYGLCHMDPDLRYMRCNEKLAEINGISAAAHLGRTLREVVPGIADAMEPVYQKVIDSGQPTLDVVASMSMDNDSQQLRHFSASYYPLKSEQGDVLGVSSIVQEITQRIEAEESLRKAHNELEKRVLERTTELNEANRKLRQEHDALITTEYRLRQLVESTNAIPWEANAKKWQCTYIGPQAEKLLGYTAQQWYEKDFWLDHIHPEDRDSAIKYSWESSQHGNEFQQVYRMYSANGSILWLHDISTVDRKNDEIVTLRGYLIDITDFKNTEKQKHQAEEEASLHRERLAHLVRTQTLGEMTSSIAHELNQPLAAIESYALAALKHSQSGLPRTEKVIQLLGKISGQTKRAGGVISHLRAMMRNRTSSPSFTDINELLILVSKLAEIDVRLHDCSLELDLTPSLPFVLVDEIQIQQVVINLIRNGLDAIASTDQPEENTIIIKSFLKQNNEIEVRVIDGGIGIIEQKSVDLFEAFYTSKESGMGMGLAICKNIIDAHGGELWYSKNEIKGATFHFTLPTKPVTPSANL